MEPIFAEAASNTVAAEVSSPLAAAIAAPPPPTVPLLQSRRTRAVCIEKQPLSASRSGPFAQGFALVSASSKSENDHILQAYFSFVHYEKTRNTHKTAEEDQKRHYTKI